MADDDDVNTWLQGLQEHKELLAHLQESVNADPTNVEAKEALEALQQAVAATEEALNAAGVALSEESSRGSECSDDDDDDDDDGDDHHVPDNNEWESQNVSYGHLQLALQESTQATMAAASMGPHAQGRVFASWEHHTRGIGSKLMAAMGYTSGRGLGVREQGMAVPLQVVLGSAKAGLGAAGQAKLQEAPSSPTKKRKRRRRRGANQPSHAQGNTTAAATQSQPQEQDMFAWLNTSTTRSIHDGHPGASSSAHAPHPSHPRMHGGGPAPKGPAPPRSQEARDLHRQERVRKLQQRVETLRATLARQQHNPGVRARVQGDLAAAEGQLAREKRGVACAETRNAQQQAVKKLLTF